MTLLFFQTINPLSISRLFDHVATLISTELEEFHKNNENIDGVCSLEISGFVSIVIPLVTLIIHIIKKVDNKNPSK